MVPGARCQRQGLQFNDGCTSPIPEAPLADDTEIEHIVKLIEQDQRPWSRLGERDTVARVYFEPRSQRDLQQMPAEMRELADAARALGFTAEPEREFGKSDSAIGGLHWLILALGSGVAGLVALNASLKAAAELPDSWRKLSDKLRAYSRVQLSPVLQLEAVHRWLDDVYGPGNWRIDYDNLLVKTLRDASVFDFREEHSGSSHRVLVVGRELTVLPPARRSMPIPATTAQNERVDLAVLTILPEEFQAVISCLDTHRHIRGSLDSPNIYSWEIGTVRAAEAEFVVVVALAGDPTNQVAAVVTQATIERFDPRYVVLVGIAGGLATQGQEHGDVVVSKIIYAYEYGKLDGGFHPRHDFTHRVDPGIANAASTFISGEREWWNAIQTRPPREKPRVIARLGAVASGNKVVDDVDDAFFSAVVQAWPKLLAVEMEGAGAAIAIETALAKGRQVGFAMVRAISDMPGTGVGTAERDAWKPYAAEAAARFLIALLRERWPVSPAKRGEDFDGRQRAHDTQLELQNRALEQQREILQQQRDTLDAQLRLQRNVALREAYNPFLTAVGRYSRELHEYYLKMVAYRGAVDSRVRHEWQQSCAEAHSEISRSLQSVLLADVDKERGSHRWRLSREVRLEPWVDTEDNQRDWIDVILYRMMQHTEHLVALRNSLHREFGETIEEKSASAREFDERLHAEAKAKAEVIEKRIAAQLKELAKLEAEQSRK